MANPEWKGKSTEELEKILQKKMDEIYELRRIISKRKGDVPAAIDVDYEKYITK